MSKKLYFLISFVLVLVLAGNVLAWEPIVWDNDFGNGDRLWDTPSNWDPPPPVTERVPDLINGNDWVVIDDYADANNGPIIDANMNAVGVWVEMGGYKSPVSEAILTMTGGTLTITGESDSCLSLGGWYGGTYRFDITGGTIDVAGEGIYAGRVAGSNATLNMSGGTIKTTDIYAAGPPPLELTAGSNATLNISGGNITTTGDFAIGSGNAQGILNMTGGDVNLAGWFDIGPYDACEGTGHVNLHGGTIEAALLAMGGGGVGTMDFAGGTLIIDGDYRIPNNWLFDPCSDDPCDDDPPGYTGTIAILAKRGLITAYDTKVGDIITGGTKVGLRAVVNLDYDVTNPGQTTITGGAVDPNLAWDPDPLNFSGGYLKADVNLLSWAAGENAASHDVYFGTSFAEVNDATTPLATQPLADVNYPVSTTWDTTYHWRIDEVNGPTTWKGTVWNFVTISARATNPSPEDGAGDVSPLVVLSWDPGPEANAVNGHHVYFSSDFDDVNDRDPSVRTVRDTNNYPPGVIELDTRYYWAVDEVNNNKDPNVWLGEVWDFRTNDHLTPDNFNSYADNAAIQAVWRKETDADADAKIEVATDPAIDGNSMMYAYRNALTSGAEANAVTTDLFAGSNWTYSGVEALVLYFYGDAGNGQEMYAHPETADYTINNDQMYVALEDGDANVGIVKYYDKVEGYDMNAIQEESWHQWNIDLEDPCLDDVNMANVVKVYIGFGGAKTGQTVNGVGWKSGNYDTVWFDDIQLWPPRCRSEKVVADITGDCVTNYKDVDIMARDWLMYDYNVPAVAISSPPVGWWKLDEGSGGTTADSSSYDNDGTIYNEDWVDGYPNDPNNSALHFDADGIAYYDRVICAVRSGTDPGTYPLELRPTTFTVACWVKLDSFTYYDGLVVNGYDDTGQDQSGFYLFGASTDAKDFGLGIRTKDLMNYVSTPDIYETDTWYHLAATYNDANTATVYVDGKLAAGPRDVGGPIRWVSSYSGNYPDYFVIGGLPIRDSMDWLYADGTIDDVRVYNYALSYGEIVTLAEQGPALYVEMISAANIYDLEEKLSKKVNFRDYVILADHWLEGPILWP